MGFLVAWLGISAPGRGSRSSYYERSITVFHNSKFFEHYDWKDSDKYHSEVTFSCACPVYTARNSAAQRPRVEEPKIVKASKLANLKSMLALGPVLLRTRTFAGVPSDRSSSIGVYISRQTPLNRRQGSLVGGSSGLEVPRTGPRPWGDLGA